MKKQTDTQLLRSLEQDPQAGMVLLMESFTGLVWKIASRHLSNPEDIRECTNDVFAEFYFHRDSYDSTQASLATWLAAIARNTAISRYRKEQKNQSNVQEAEIPVDFAMLNLAEAKADLEEAIKTLRPDEQQIIRMKYYDNMTIAEIAASLDLPYETVKKRHQRSLQKMRPFVMFILILVLLLATTTVTSYAILRKLDRVPKFLRWVEDWLPDGLLGDWGGSDDTGDGDDRTDDAAGWNDTWRYQGEDRNPSDEAPVQDSEESPEGVIERTDIGISSRMDLITGNDFSSNGAGDNEFAGDAAASIENYRYIPGYGIAIIPGGNSGAGIGGSITGNVGDGDTGSGTGAGGTAGAGSGSNVSMTSYVLSAGTAAEDDETAVAVQSASCINDELKITVTVHSKTDPWQRISTADAVRIQDLSDAVLSCQGETVEFSIGQGSLTEDAYTMNVTLIIPDFELEAQEEIAMSLTLYGVSMDFTMTATEGEAIEDNYLYQIGQYGGLMIIPRREEEELIISIYPLNAGAYVTLPGLVRGSSGETYEDGILTVTDAEGNCYTGTCVRYRPGGSNTYYEWNFGTVPAGEYSLYIPYLIQMASDDEQADALLDLTVQPSQTTTVSVLGGTVSVSYSELYHLSHDSEEYLAYEKKQAFLSSIGGSAEYMNPDNFDYYDLAVSWTTNDANHSIVGMNPYFSCDYNTEGNTGTAIVGGDMKLMSSDAAACSAQYRCAINRAYDDPSTLHMTFPLFTDWMPRVWYRWNRSFDFTFIVE